MTLNLYKKYTSLYPHVMEARLALGSGGWDIWQEAIRSDLLLAKPHIIKKDQSLAKHGPFFTLLHRF